MNAIKTNNAYKTQKAIEKLEQKQAEKIEKRKVYLLELKRRALEKATSGITNKYGKKLTRFIKKKEKECNIKKRELIGKKAFKKDLSVK